MTTKKVLLLKIAVVTAAAVLLVIGMLGCNATSSSEYPDTLDTYVYDPAGVLSDDTVDHIISLNESLSNQTGGEIIVACISSTGYTDIADYAYEMFNTWQIGDADENNGVLLLLSIGEDDYWCLQGEGLEKTLSSGKIKTILNEYLEPYFAVGDYDSGVRTTFDALIEEFEAAYSVDILNGSSAGTLYDDYYYNDYYDDYYDYSAGIGTAFTSFIEGLIILGIIIFIIAAIVIAAIIPPYRRHRPHRGIFAPPPPRHHHNPPPPHHGGFGGPIGGGPRPGGNPGGHRPGGFSGGSRPGGFGGGRSGGFGGGHSGGSRSGGGMSRGGGAGRR